MKHTGVFSKRRLQVFLVLLLFALSPLFYWLARWPSLKNNSLESETIIVNSKISLEFVTPKMSAVNGEHEKIN